MNLTCPEDAHQLLKNLGASQRLITHLCLVGEAANEILAFLLDYGVNIDYDFVRLGVAVHDAGKIKYTSEFDGPGNQHEPEGEQMLLDVGVRPDIARCCLSHARYATMACSLEELLVALSDTLWKGVRKESLEVDIIKRIADSLGKDRWDIFIDLDNCFESIAEKGTERLERSK